MHVMEPMSTGSQCDMDCSCMVQSFMILTVRSVGSFCPKNDRGSLLSFSARAMRLAELSL